MLITANRNDATSLQATLLRENTPTARPVLTISRREDLNRSDYRKRVLLRLAELILDLDNVRGMGRLYLP